VFTMSFRNKMKVPVITMFLNKSITTERFTNLSRKKPFWPIITVVPKGMSILRNAGCLSKGAAETFFKADRSDGTQRILPQRGTFMIPVGLPRKIYDNLSVSVINELRDIPGVSAILRINLAKDEEAMFREFEKKTLYAPFISAFINEDVLADVSDADIPGELKMIITDFVSKTLSDIVPYVEETINTDIVTPAKEDLDKINEISALAEVIIRALPHGRLYRLSEQSVSQMSVENGFNKFHSQKPVHNGHAEYLKRSIETTNQHYLVHFADGKAILSRQGPVTIPPGLEIQKRRKAQKVSRSLDPDHDKFFIIAPKNNMTEKQKHKFRDKIIKLWMLDRIVFPENVIILDRKDYTVSELYFRLCRDHKEVTKTNTGFRCLNGFLQYDSKASKLGLLQVNMAPDAASSINQYEVFINLLLSREKGDMEYAIPGLAEHVKGFYIYMPEASAIDLEIRIRKYYDRYVKEIRVKA